MKLLLGKRNLLLGILASVMSFYVCAKEGEAISAVSIPKNITTYTVKHDGSYIEEHEIIRLVEIEDAVSWAGDVSISYSPKLETLKIIEAYTTLPDGTRIEVPQKSIYTAKGKVGNGFSDEVTTMVIFPNVKVGSQLTYKYIKICHTPLFARHFAIRRFFSPFVKGTSEVNINADSKLKLQVDSKGMAGGRLADKDGMHHYHFSRQQDVALEAEEGEVSSVDFSDYVHASTFVSHEELAAAYGAMVKPKIVITPEIKKLAEELTGGIENPEDQVRVLYNWVSKNIRYVAAYLQNEGYVPHDSQTVLSNRWGDCKDHHVILEAMLAGKGIQSSGVLINTGPTYVQRKLASIGAYNHVITYVPSLDLYLDSTAQFAPMGVLPASDIGKHVLLTGLVKTAKTPSMLADGNKTYTRIKLEMLPDGKIQGDSELFKIGVAEIALRNERSTSQNTTNSKMAELMLEKNNLIGKGDMRSTDPYDLEQPLVINLDFKVEPIINIPGPGAFHIPIGLAYEAITSTTLSKPKDKFTRPLQCSSFVDRNLIEIKFPENVKITRIPENVEYKDRVVKYTSNYELADKRLVVTRELIVQNDGMVCGEAENELEKQFMPIFQRDMRAQVMYE